MGAQSVTRLGSKVCTGLRGRQDKQLCVPPSYQILFLVFSDVMGVWVSTEPEKSDLLFHPLPKVSSWDTQATGA